MADTVRIASFNAENLFSRARIMNLQNNGKTKGLLNKVERLRAELAKKTYNETAIIELYNELKDYNEIVEVRGKLFRVKGKSLRATGVDDWGGFIDFKRDRFSEAARANTAQVLRTVNADICSLIEVESRPVLEHFCIDQLPRVKGKFEQYKHLMLVDGNDPRGIDVALASRHPIGWMRSHVDDSFTTDKGRSEHIFSRDCIELNVEVSVGGG
jgi:hypothetical protein